MDKDSSNSIEKEEEPFPNLLLINNVTYQKWYVKIDLVIYNEFTIENAIAPIDSRADMTVFKKV